MSLQDDVKLILNNFDSVSPEKILEILTKIQPHLKNNITQDYLKGKIKAALYVDDISEKKKLCKNLKPYLDWYLQGTN
jgi:hypothetical protein